MNKIGLKIKSARKLNKITQEDLAQAIGVSDKSISAYESQRVTPSLAVLKKIADKTNQNLSFFLEDSVEESIIARLRVVEAELKEIKKLIRKQK